MFIFLAIIINISIIIYFFIKLFIQTCNYCVFMLVSWILLAHTCFKDDARHVLTNYK